jgi:hypothetical protein
MGCTWSFIQLSERFGRVGYSEIPFKWGAFRSYDFPNQLTNVFLGALFFIDQRSFSGRHCGKRGKPPRIVISKMANMVTNLISRAF